MSNRSKKPQGDQYKRGYANGVRAAVDALLGDLERTGKLTAADYDENGYSKSCIACLLRESEFHHLADRWQFAMGVKCAPATGQEGS